MSRLSPRDPVLDRFRSIVGGVYGARLERVILYGSRARGGARPDSDYDIAVFLREMPDRPFEVKRLADISTSILYDLGGVIHAIPYLADSYDRRTPIMHEIRLDGVSL